MEDYESKTRQLSRTEGELDILREERDDLRAKYVWYACLFLFPIIDPPMNVFPFHFDVSRGFVFPFRERCCDRLQKDIKCLGMLEKCE